MKDSQERDFERSFKPTVKRHCCICGSQEPFGADGNPTRYIKVGDQWACNFCNNQRPGA